MHHHALRFVYDRHVFVLIHYVERNILRLDFKHFGSRQFKLDYVAFFEFVSAFLRFTPLTKAPSFSMTVFAFERDIAHFSAINVSSLIFSLSTSYAIQFKQKRAAL